MITYWPQVSRSVALAANEAHVWAVPLADRRMLNEDLAILSSDERRRAERFRVEVPRRRYIVARAALRALLGRYLNAAACEIALTNGANGKPRLAQQNCSSSLHFNVAHSEELALIAVAPGCEVGVDVERLRVISHWEEIARRYFHDAEARAILELPQSAQMRAFLTCWTAKEAVLKALGLGLSGSLSAFQVPIEYHRGGWLQVPADGMGHVVSVWRQSLVACSDFVSAFAATEEIRRVRGFTFQW